MVLVLAVYKIYIHLEYSRLKYFHQICNVVDLTDIIPKVLLLDR